MTPLLSTAYLPPISYINECMRSGKIMLERHEHYIKQTYRNRANIYGANGLLPLIIPVQHENVFTIPIRDVRISYDTAWQKIHWRSITSAYRNSAWFEFFEDALAPFYHTKYETLFEFNLELLKKIFSLMKAEVEISFTTQYEKEPTSVQNLRNTFNPAAINIEVEPYYQVFADRFGFINDLSIIDLLFNKRGNVIHCKSHNYCFPHQT